LSGMIKKNLLHPATYHLRHESSLCLAIHTVRTTRPLFW
jgi:hypothetical protein